MSKHPVTTNLAERYSTAELAPYSGAIRTTRIWLCLIAVRHPEWREPVANLGDNEIELEWWRSGRCVLLSVAADKVSFLKSWGSDPVLEMEDGELAHPSDFDALWKWLNA